MTDDDRDASRDLPESATTSADGDALAGGEFTAEMHDGEAEADDRSGSTDGDVEGAA